MNLKTFYGNIRLIFGGLIKGRHSNNNPRRAP
jgi:hypothetical protein